MLTILFQDDCEDIAKRAADDLLTAFTGNVEVVLTAARNPSVREVEPSWDDLLVVLYSGDGFPEQGNEFIAEFVRQRPDTVQLLPVAAANDPTHRRPPRAAAAIKALVYDAAAAGVKGRLVKRVGAMLGLRLQGRDTRIFVSYREKDGKHVAKQVHDHLLEVGYRAFLDEAEELDGETSILPGTDVQAAIDEALENASLLLLIDTPEAPGSSWIKHEVDTANGMLLPILPMCLRKADDNRKGSRFPSLLALQRYIQVVHTDPVDSLRLTATDLTEAVNEIETYLCEILQRKCRVPFIVEREFVSRDYAWKVLDKRLMMFESEKTFSTRLQTRVNSHCSHFDQIFPPALRRFGTFLDEKGRGNFALFVYDGELLSDGILTDLGRGVEGIIILHHQELAVAIESHFTKLRAA